MIEILIIFVVLGFLFWILNKKRGDTTKVLIGIPFEDIKVGKVAVFKSGHFIKDGDFVLIKIPGYEMIWKVSSVKGEKLELRNRKGELLIGFPKCYVKGKLVEYLD